MIRNFLALTLLFGIFVSTKAQNPAKFADLNESAIGMYNLAMGNTGVASSVDVDALYLNPSLLVKLNNVNFTISSNSVVPLNGKDQKNYFVLSDGLLNNVALGIPIKINDFKMALGFSYRPAYNWSEKVLRLSGNSGVLSESNSGPKVISVGFAFSSFEEFSIGFSYNKVIGTQTFKSSNYVFASPVPDLIDIDIDNLSPVSKSEQTYDFDYKYWELGASTYLFNRLKLGAKIRTPYTSKLNEGNSATKYDFPVFYTLGSEFRLGRHSFIDVDYQKHDYTQAKLPEKPNTALSKYNLNNFRYGFKFSGSRGAYFALGYQHKKYLENDLDGSQKRTHAISLGFGTPIGRLVWRNAVQAEISNFSLEDILPEKIWVGTEFLFFFKSHKK